MQEGQGMHWYFVTSLILSLTWAGFACIARGHMVEYVLHGAAVGQIACPQVPIGLLPPLTLVSV